MKTYYDEEQYLAMHGGGNLIGTSISIQSHIDRRGEAVQELTRQLDILEAKNREARELMKRELESGDIRFMTPKEKIIIQAAGHPDNESTAAARRCLAKRRAMLL